MTGLGATVDKLWVVVDASGSISDDTLAEAMAEICEAVIQVNISGWLSFFDTDVTKPEPFESIDELMNITPIGAGGTSFNVIFDSIDDMFSEELPTLMLILTDGYADFPSEESAKDISVIWINIDSDIEPPWGQCVHITSKE